MPHAHHLSSLILLFSYLSSTIYYNLINMSLSRSFLSSARCLRRPNYAQQLRFSSSSASSESESDSLGVTVTELSNILAEEHELSKAQSKRIVTSLFENIAEVRSVAYVGLH